MPIRLHFAGSAAPLVREWMRQFDRPDDFDLDIRLEPVRRPAVLIPLPHRIRADHSRPDNAPCQTDPGSTCQTCQTCQTCDTCQQATCHTCAATCDTCPGDQTCDTCAGQATCDRTCAGDTCDTCQGTCQDTCQTCDTNCNQQTCNTCGQTCATCGDYTCPGHDPGCLPGP